MLDSGIPKPPPALYDPAELDEDVDLERDHRRKVLDAYYTLSDLDLYQVLGIDRTADKKAVKRAYYELATLHHPDRRTSSVASGRAKKRNGTNVVPRPAETCMTVPFRSYRPSA